MFTTVTTNIRMGVTAAKPSAILFSVSHYFIAVVRSSSLKKMIPNRMFNKVAY